jgi:hypothetical protein
MDKKAAVSALYDSDHAFLTREFGIELCHVFGVRPKDAQCFLVDPTDFKGLTVEGKKKGDKVYGYDARNLADYIASKLDPNFSNPCFGRGSGLRYAVGSIEVSIGLRKAKGA